VPEGVGPGGIVKEQTSMSRVVGARLRPMEEAIELYGRVNSRLY
jgi:hypothetical protein